VSYDITGVDTSSIKSQPCENEIASKYDQHFHVIVNFHQNLITFGAP